ncbi:hypothetical protein DGMP_01200 [Desulfomarina profundi]|uniref:Glycosyltransferase subfamily 4-like N-terminal domain-containing protein n=1 Tax=Desulfomarina profundi TaxID=2772557 RepID=A0A8D5FDA6_9BACT|nr:glycosyltransferase [Desulfomarina profundi]BCL59427.1 hypothetical protein DGMP_01200 [Desulfomarina profundi]
MSQTRKIKILIITDTRVSGLGGSEKHIRFILDNLDLLTFEFHVAEFQGADSLKTKNDILEEKTWPNVSLIKLDVKRIYGTGALKALFILSRIVRKEKIDITISFHEKSDIINALLFKNKQGKPVKISSRRDMYICPSSFLLNLRKLLSPFYDYITAPCKAILDKVSEIENFPEDRMHVIHNSVDTSFYVPNDKTFLSSHKKAITGKYKIACIGNLKEVKGHRYLLEAFSIFLNEFPESQLLLVGEDNGSENDIINQIKNLSLNKSVFLLGGRTDISSILQECDFIVSASLSEGLSNALLEGLSCGLPIIATDVGGNREIVMDGTNGFLCRPANSAEMADKMLHLCHNCDLFEFSKKSRKMACLKFSTGQLLESYNAFFQKFQI